MMINNVMSKCSRPDLKDGECGVIINAAKGIESAKAWGKKIQIQKV